MLKIAERPIDKGFLPLGEMIRELGFRDPVKKHAFVSTCTTRNRHKQGKTAERDLGSTAHAVGFFSPEVNTGQGHRHT